MEDAYSCRQGSTPRPLPNPPKGNPIKWVVGTIQVLYFGGWLLTTDDCAKDHGGIVEEIRPGYVPRCLGDQPPALPKPPLVPKDSSEDCSPAPTPKECAPGTEQKAKTGMTCKVPKCILDSLKRDEWPGIGFGVHPPVGGSFFQKGAAAAEGAPAMPVGPGAPAVGGGEEDNNCVCLGAVNQQGANAGHESVDSPDFNADGSIDVPKDQVGIFSKKGVSSR